MGICASEQSHAKEKLESAHSVDELRAFIAEYEATPGLEEEVRAAKDKLQLAQWKAEQAWLDAGEQIRVECRILAGGLREKLEATLSQRLSVSKHNSFENGLSPNFNRDMIETLL